MSWIRTTLCSIGAIVLGAAAQRLAVHPQASVPTQSAAPTVSQTAPETPPSPTIEAVLSAKGAEQRQLLSRFLPTAGIDDLEILAEHWPSKEASQPPSIQTWRLILARWVELDPPRAIAVETSLGIRNIQGWCYHVWSWRQPLKALQAAQSDSIQAVRLVILEVAKQELSTALTLIDKYPSDHTILRNIFRHWAKTAPIEALAGVDRIALELQPKIRNAIAWAISANDPKAGLALAESLTDPIAQLRAEQVAIEAMIADEPSTAATHIEALPQSNRRYSLFTKLAYARAKADPAAALTWGKSLPEGSEKQAAIAAAVKALDLPLNELTNLLDEIGWHHLEYNLQDVVEIGGFTSFGSEGSIQRELIDKLATAGPDALLNVLGKLPPTERLRGQLMKAMTERLLWESPDTLLTLVHNLPDRKLAKSLLSTIQWKAQDADTLLTFEELLLSSDQSNERRRAIKSFSQRLARLDTEASLAWAHSLPNEQERLAAVREGFREIGKRSSSVAMAHFDTLTDPKVRREAAVEVLDAVARDDLTQAIDWFDSLVETDVSPTAHSHLASHWFKQDSLAASEWVSSLSPGVHRDSAAHVIVVNLIQGSQTDFPAAYAWASTIEGGWKETTMRQLFGFWIHHDRAAALDVLSESDLPQHIQARLLKSNR